MQGEQNTAWYTLFAHVPFLFIIYILLCYTKIMVYFCLLAKKPHYMVTLPVRHIRAVLKSETINIAFKVTVSIVLFEVIKELQMERLYWSSATAMIPASKELNT